MAVPESEMIEYWEKQLEKQELLETGERVETQVMGSYMDLFGTYSVNIYFTSKKLVAISGLGTVYVVLPYTSIVEIEKFRYMLCPTGVTLVVPDEKKGKMQNVNFIIWGRQKYLDLLERKTGIVCK